MDENNDVEGSPSCTEERKNPRAASDMVCLNLRVMSKVLTDVVHRRDEWIGMTDLIVWSMRRSSAT